MDSTNEACAQLLAKVKDCLAVGVVDLDTSMLVGVHHITPHFTQAYLDAIAAATVDMMRGPGVRQIEQLLSKQKGEEVKDAFEEILVASSKTLHFIAAAKEKRAAIVMVTRRSANQGLAWLELRCSTPKICETLP